MISETSKIRELVWPYLLEHPVLDIGSGGDPCCPWAIQCDLPFGDFKKYGEHRSQHDPIHLRQDGTRNLPFRHETIAALYSSHLLEDYLKSEWPHIICEWCRVLRSGGYLIIALPDRGLFREAVAKGQPDNPHHKHEAAPGELSEIAVQFGLKVIRDSIVENTYTVLGIFQK